MKKLALTLLASSLLALSFAEARQQYSVTGKSSHVNAFYHDRIECDLAIQDAQDQASTICYKEGGSGNWTYAQWGDCHHRLFGGGQYIRMTFFCE